MGTQNEDGHWQRLLNSPVYRLIRSLIINLRKHCRCSLVDGPHLQQLHRRATSRGALEPISDTYRDAALHFGRWSDLFLILYILSSLHLVLYLYHQHKLDWNLLRLDYLSFRQKTQSYLDAEKPITNDLLDKLNRKVDEENAMLDLIGQPLKQITFFAQMIFWLELLFSLVSYLLTQLYMRYYHPFDLYIVRILIDYNREVELCRMIINKQVDDFLISLRNFRKILVFSRMDLGPTGGLNRLIVLDNARVQLECDHFIERELLDMKNSDKLLPANRQIEWIASWLKPCLATLLLSYTSLLGYNCLFFSLVYFSSMFRPLSYSEVRPNWLTYNLADWLVIFESLVFLLVIISPVVFYGTTTALAVVDQMRLANRLTCTHEQLLEQSQLELMRAESWNCHRRHFGGTAPRRVAQQNSTEENLRRELNCRLLKLLMQFRIYTKLFVKEREILGFHGFLEVIILLLLPVVMRLHSPYFDPKLEWMNAYLTVSSFITVTGVSVGVSMMCELFNSCVNLHRAQSKLLAHIIQVEQFYPNFYNNHLVSRLRRETGSYDSLVEQFTISFAGVKFTYASVIWLYFWFGALVLSSIIKPNPIMPGRDPNTGKPIRRYPMIVENVLDDPFNVFKW